MDSASTDVDSASTDEALDTSGTRSSHFCKSGTPWVRPRAPDGLTEPTEPTSLCARVQGARLGELSGCSRAVIDLLQRLGTDRSTWVTRPIFISSTFRDMQAERDYLRNFVFPELEERLRARRHCLEPFDLRLGLYVVVGVV